MKFTSVDEYVLSTLSKPAQKALNEIRRIIKATVPRSEEGISYNMPACKVNGQYFVSFAAWKNHIGMYPIPEGNLAFQKEALKYKGSKSTLVFPLDKPMPLKFIAKVVKYRIADNAKRAKTKTQKKK